MRRDKSLWSLNDYLRILNKHLRVNDSRKVKMREVQEIISEKIPHHFSSVIEHFSFGSSRFNALLPESIDPEGDLDYLVVFRDERRNPDYYLSQLKKFCSQSMRGCEIDYDHPSLIISMRGVKIDLVPSLKVSSENYKIPRTKFDWKQTTPLHGVEYFKHQENVGASVLRLIKYLNLHCGNGIAPYVLKDLVVERLKANGIHFNESGQLLSSFIDVLAFYEKRFGTGDYKSVWVYPAKSPFESTKYDYDGIIKVMPLPLSLP